MPLLHTLKWVTSLNVASGLKKKSRRNVNLKNCSTFSIHSNELLALSCLVVRKNNSRKIKSEK
jgi:hypothetical protein